MSKHARHRSSRLGTVVAILFVAGASMNAAQAQWSIVNLHPAGSTFSEARGVKDGQQVGFSGDLAIVWAGTADSAVVLNPTPGQPAAAVSVQGGVQAGRANVPFENLWRMHAALWSGSAESFVDLHPGEFATNSQITAIHGDTQGGIWFAPSEDQFSLGRPCLWHGSPESFVDLTSPGVDFAEVRGVHGNQQVGGNFSAFLPRACMWTGTPESYVDLQPANALYSVAECTDGARQYGGCIIWDLEDFDTAALQVGYWTGTPESWTDMTPAGRFGGIITAVDGAQQVGVTAADAIGNPPFQAALWSGTAASYVDLHSFLPTEYTESTAYGIWHDPNGATYVVGSALNSNTNQTEAIMWVSGQPCAADFNNSGEVNSQDFFDFVSAFFSALPAADFNHDAVINSQDFFDFVAAFFIGC